MKTPAIFLIIAFFATVVRADITIVQKVEQEAHPEKSVTMTMKIKGDKIRMDMNPKVSTIMDIKSGDVQTLMHDQKIVMAIPGAMVKAMQQQALASDVAGTATDATLTPTGKKETISGFACEEYVMTSDDTKIHVWLTQDLPAAEKVLAEMAAASPQTDPFKGLMKDKKVSGFPMRSEIEMPGGKKMTVTVVALSEEPLPASDFVVPDGYKTMQVPSIPPH